MKDWLGFSTSMLWAHRPWALNSRQCLELPLTFPWERMLRYGSLRRKGSGAARCQTDLLYGLFVNQGVCLWQMDGLDKVEPALTERHNRISKSIRDCCPTSCSMTFYYPADLTLVFAFVLRHFSSFLPLFYSLCFKY